MIYTERQILFELLELRIKCISGSNKNPWKNNVILLSENHLLEQNKMGILKFAFLKISTNHINSDSIADT